MEAAYLLDVGTIWINCFPIERGVQPRQQSGNYQIGGFKVRSIFIKSNLKLCFHSYDFVFNFVEFEKFSQAKV